MKHLIFLIPNFKETCEIAKELERFGVDESALHVYSNDDPESLKAAHLRSLNVAQMVNLSLLVGRAIVLGVIFSVCIYLLFLLELPASLHIHTLGYFAIVAFGMGFGFWVSGMIGVQSLNDFIEKYQSYVRAGHYLMMVDALDKREKELTDLILSHHADVHLSDITKH